MWAIHFFSRSLCICILLSILYVLTSLQILYVMDKWMHQERHLGDVNLVILWICDFKWKNLTQFKHWLDYCFSSSSAAAVLLVSLKIGSFLRGDCTGISSSIWVKYLDCFLLPVAIVNQCIGASSMWLFIVVGHALNSEWTYYRADRRTQISCFGNRKIPIWGGSSSEFRVSETGPGDIWNFILLFYFSL